MRWLVHKDLIKTLVTGHCGYSNAWPLFDPSLKYKPRQRAVNHNPWRVGEVGGALKTWPLVTLGRGFTHCHRWRACTYSAQFKTWSYHSVCGWKILSNNDSNFNKYIHNFSPQNISFLLVWIMRTLRTLNYGVDDFCNKHNYWNTRRFLCKRFAKWLGFS